MSDTPTTQKPETQTIEEHALSPQCLAGQHETCLQKISYMGDDGVARTMVCSCRCHDRKPTTAAGATPEPEVMYRISWEYEAKQTNEAGEEVTAWMKRRVLTDSRGIAEDWLDGIATLITTHKVRNLRVLKATIGLWEEVK